MAIRTLLNCVSKKKIEKEKRHKIYTVVSSTSLDGFIIICISFVELSAMLGTVFHIVCDVSIKTISFELDN